MTRDSSITGGGGGGWEDDLAAESADLSVGGDWLLGVESHVPLESLQKSNCKIKHREEKVQHKDTSNNFFICVKGFFLTHILLINSYWDSQ